MPSPLDRREPCQCEGDGINAGTEIDDRVAPGAVGYRRAHLLDQGFARRLDRHARQHGPGSILDQPRDARLGVGIRRDQERQHARARRLNKQSAHTLILLIRVFSAVAGVESQAAIRPSDLRSRSSRLYPQSFSTAPSFRSRSPVLVRLLIVALPARMVSAIVVAV